MKRVLALAAMTAALAGCSTGLFQSAVPNTLPGTPAASVPPPAAAPVTPISSAPVASVSTSPAETVRLDARDQGLLDADRSFAGAVLDHGLGAGLAAIVEADATVLTPAGAFVGADQIRTGLRPGANAGQLFWIPEKASTGASADYGSTSGRYVQVLRGAEAVQGRYVTVWRKDAASRWRIVSTTAMPVRIAAPVATTAPAAAPPAKKPVRR
ncbi:MAG TPA: DUF4440 domain-containing protein [Caulobacterales bacterium]|nr:DUF4440 domain-containing protein [Caulobacterales bacterium]